MPKRSQRRTRGRGSSVGAGGQRVRYHGIGRVGEVGRRGLAAGNGASSTGNTGVPVSLSRTNRNQLGRLRHHIDFCPGATVSNGGAVGRSRRRMSLDETSESAQLPALADRATAGVSA